MNRLLLMIVLVCVFIAPQAWGATSTNPNPYRQTMWNNITDGVHTFGQNPRQKKTTLRKLHNARTRTRVKNMNKANMAKFKAKHKAWVASQNP